MWQSVLANIKRLRSIDLQCQAFGAQRHRYRLYPVVTDADVGSAESALETTFPESLRSFFVGVGDGVVGPYYGLRRVAEVSGFRPDMPYPGIEFFRRAAAAHGFLPDNQVDEGYFQLPRKELRGLLTIIDEGCGHQICLIANGPLMGRVVYVSADGFVAETEKTMIDLYADWLDRELDLFQAVQVLMESRKSYSQIKSEMIQRYRDYRSGDRISSIADVPKPVALFGTGNQRIVQGKTQFPWYEQVLADWQQANL